MTNNQRLMTRYALRELTIAATRYYDYGKISIFHTQIRAYVDDLLIIEENLQFHYQIKDVVKLTWGNGENSLLDNFQKQIALNEHINIASRTIIVVSNQDVYEHLKKTIPDSIKTNTDVVLFQNKHIDRLIYDEPKKADLKLYQVRNGRHTLILTIC